MNPQDKWRLVYRTGRIACPNRTDLQHDPFCADWRTAPRGIATHNIIEAIHHATNNGLSEFSRLYGVVIDALTPPEPMRIKLRERALNNFGMLNPWRSWRVPNWHDLNNRRENLIHRLDARGLLSRDDGNWIRRVAL